MNVPLATLAACALALAPSAQSFPWTTLSPVSPPSARERVGSATDGSVLYLYGGQVGTTTVGSDNLLSFDGSEWTEITAPGAGAGPRSNPAMAWDDARGKLVVFGGKGDAVSWDNRLQDTWEWDAAGGWIQMSPATVPDARWFASAVYAPGVGVVLHGGNAVDGTGTQYTDDRTWAWDGTDWSVIATGPEKQNYTSVYRSATHDLVLFGGNSTTSSPKSADTWKLDLTSMAWSQVVTATLPTSSAATGGPGLVGAAGYLNPTSGKFVLHGGQGNGGPPSSWTWEFDGVDWTDVSFPDTANIRNAPGEWLAATGRGYALCGNSSGSPRDWIQEHGPLANFTGSPAQLSLSAGGTQDLTLDAGLSNALLPYLIVGSASGSSPGFPVDGLTLPINFDAYTLFTLGNANTATLQDTFSVLDASGQSTAAVVVPPGTSPGLAGLVLTHAYVAIQTAPTIQVGFASDPVDLGLVP